MSIENVTEKGARMMFAAEGMYGILKDLRDLEECELDHHGYCQTHGWLQEGRCPQLRIKEIIAKVEAMKE